MVCLWEQSGRAADLFLRRGSARSCPGVAFDRPDGRHHQLSKQTLTLCEAVTPSSSRLYAISSWLAPSLRSMPWGCFAQIRAPFQRDPLVWEQDIPLPAARVASLLLEASSRLRLRPSQMIRGRLRSSGAFLAKGDPRHLFAACHLRRGIVVVAEGKEKRVGFPPPRKMLGEYQRKASRSQSSADAGGEA